MEFERIKNIKAGTITAAIIGVLLLLAFLVSWTNPVPESPMLDEGMEVNLGNSEMGLGDEAPMIPGPPAERVLESNTPPSTLTEAEDPAKEVETNDDDKEAPKVVVPKPVTPKKEVTKIPVKEVAPKITKPKAAPVPTPTPTPKKPAAVYKGGTAKGTGGNDADSYTNKKSQGVAGGTGDQGKPGGNPDSDNYNGNGGTGNGSATILRGLPNRKIYNPSFEDDFNENGKIAVDVKVNASGKVISASYQSKGSTTSNPTLKKIALEKAYSLKFSTSDNAAEAIGTVIFNFKIKG